MSCHHLAEDPHLSSCDGLSKPVQVCRCYDLILLWMFFKEFSFKHRSQRRLGECQWSSLSAAANTQLQLPIMSLGCKQMSYHLPVSFMFIYCKVPLFIVFIHVQHIVMLDN